MRDDRGAWSGTVVGPGDAVTPVARPKEQELSPEEQELNGVVDSGEVVDDDLADEDVADEDDIDDEDVDLSILEEEGDIAADYIEGLLDIADLDGDIDMDVEGDRAVVSVVGATLDELVGDDGEVLEALQELTRLAVHRKTGVRARLMLDVADSARADALS